MSLNDPLISIVIPTFNRAAIIEETLLSIQKQTFENWECLVIDDGSTDGTEDMLKKWSIKDPRFTFLKRPKDRQKGANACRNYGLDHSRGKYINFFDSDDLMVPNKLATDLEYFKNKVIDFTISQTHFFYTENGEFFRYWNDHLYSTSPIHDFITLQIGWSTNAPLWKKSSLVTNELRFDESLTNGQDYLFHALALIKGMRPSIHTNVLVYQREHKDKIEHQIIKAPAKARINSFLLNAKSKLESRTVVFLKGQSIRVLSSLFKHKKWAQGVKFSWSLLRHHSFAAFLTILKLNFFGIVYRLSGMGYSLLDVSNWYESEKFNDKA